MFAEKTGNEEYKIEDVYFESSVGNFAFVKLYNNKKYKKFCNEYFKRHMDDYENHNYIGDWHSHPSFSCYPSMFDKEEVIKDLECSNAKFLIQVILKDDNNKLIGNAFLYNMCETATKVKLIIENHPLM